MLPAWTLFIAVFVAQTPSLIKDAKWAELAVFLVMWLGGVVYGTAVLLEALPMTPTEIIINIMSGVKGIVTGN